jgi:sterol desaturase/sphingolipid hydroxylase (fatty acid hydroxylase superfamily)
MDSWWLSFLAKTGIDQYDERLIFSLGLWRTNLIVFYGCNLLLYVMYSRNMFPQYRINTGKMPSQELIWDCIWHNVKNNLFFQPLAAYFVAYPIFQYFSIKNGYHSLVFRPFPSWSIVLRDLIIAYIVNDTLFYWAHRALHHSSIYKYIHKKHHMFNYTIGIAATYAHPVEDVLANLIPTLAGCCVISSHFVVFLAWLAWRLIETIEAHSGYSFPYSPFTCIPVPGETDRHDFHHSHNTGCYGGWFWDWLCGTDKTFHEFKRQQVLRQQSMKKAKDQ